MPTGQKPTTPTGNLIQPTILQGTNTLPLFTQDNVPTLEDVQKLVATLAVQRADAFANILEKPVKAPKAPKAKATPLSKKSLSGGDKTSPDAATPSPAPRKKPTKPQLMKLFWRKSQGETLTEQEEADLALLNP